jgi:hypothetical protein
MKKTILFLTSIIAGNLLLAQNAAAPKKPVPVTLKKIMELKMPRTADDEYPGKRGASVLWHPKQKKYYAAMAGNAFYPLGVFDAKGKLLSPVELDCLQDTRGLWYDAAQDKITANGYNETGWFTYILDTKGIPADYETLLEGKVQPNEQCVGAFDSRNKKICFLDGSTVYFYDATTGDIADEFVQLHWGRTKKDGPADDESATEAAPGYNTSTIIYSGLPGAEIGVLNTELKQIELYDLKEGFLKKSIKLPATAITETTFNFAFTNGIYWLFDMESRKWIGYK